MYDLVASKVIINCDIEFIENESWDATVEKNVKIVLNVEHDDMMKEVVQTAHAIQPIAAPLTPMTPWHSSTQGTLTQVVAQATSSRKPRGQQTALTNSSRPTSTDPVKKYGNKPWMNKPSTSISERCQRGSMGTSHG